MTLTCAQISVINALAPLTANEVVITDGSIEGFVLVGIFDVRGNLIRDLTINKAGRIFYDYTPENLGNVGVVREIVPTSIRVFQEDGA